MNTLFVKTYKENEGGGSGDTESEAIAKCFDIYKDTYATFHKVTRNGKLD